MCPELPAIDAAIFPAYLDGLAAEDYKVDPAQVRAGYVGGLAARSALCAIPVEKLGQAPTAELTELFVDRLKLTRLMVDMAREVILPSQRHAAEGRASWPSATSSAMLCSRSALCHFRRRTAGEDR